MKKHVAAISILCAAVCGLPAPAQQARDEVEITGAVVGYPAAGQPRNSLRSNLMFKEGAWAPMYIDVKCNRPLSQPAELVIESLDCDHMPTRYTTPLPVIPPGQNETIISYVRSGSRNENINIRIERNGRSICPDVSMPANGLDPSQFLFLSIGASLDGVPLPNIVQDDGTNPNVQVNERSLHASIRQPNLMPTQWFAYQTTDTVFLCTSDRDFTTQLVSERDGRKAALIEWVRRGGSLVVSIGKNQDLLAGAQELTDALPALPTGTAEVDIPRIAWTDSTTSNDPFGATTVAQISPKPDRPLQTLLATPRVGDKPGVPLVVRGAYGFGRVTLVAMDLDDRALSRWSGKAEFWRELANRGGTRNPSGNIEASVNYGRYGAYYENTLEDNEFRTLIQKMEDFPGVPVISFGWVALFILAYIILVGPIDYFFLKKVVKRLELTWVTFPIIVLTVSAIAYYAAYALKGSDLRINKYDLVDIDLRSKLVLGRTWFTLFSPRIQNYNIAVESAWAPAGAEPDTLVGWGGQVHQSRSSLFRRHYEYLPKAVGLRSVPVQVWSTKGFQAQWLTPLDAAQPLAKSELFVREGGRGLNGFISVNLPVPLENACLLYSEGQREPMVRMLGTLSPNTPKSVASVEPRPFKNWSNEPFGRLREIDENAGAVRGNTGAVDRSTWFPVGPMFQELRVGSDRPSNASLRTLDQSWRLLGSNPNEAILVGTLPKLDGNSEENNSNPANPTRLWFGAFPDGSGTPRPKLQGTLKQETCVRMIFDVRTSDAPRN